MSYRLAKSLVVYRDECNARWPDRDKSSDGWIGDAAHASRTSDHNPWVKDPSGVGVVRAYDLDAGEGTDTTIGLWLAEHIRQLGATGFKPLGKNSYVISAYRIASATSRWQWKRYTGPNAHIKHTHVSVGTAQSDYDCTYGWGIATALVSLPPPVDVLRRGDKSDRVRALQATLNRYYPRLTPLVVDGDFGPATEERVKYFQGKSQLVSDGVVGPATKKALGL